jgi:DNA-binding LacI/PurR family transcriptional regulator
MGRMRPSLQLIAKRLGISDATVSNALHGTGRVSIDLREKVRALARLRERNIRIPEDVSLTGFDDLMWCRFFSPRLTSVRMDHAAVAEAAIARLGGEPGPATLIPTKLIIRKSSGPVRQTSVE